jgi:hypothetical protein
MKKNLSVATLKQFENYAHKWVDSIAHASKRAIDNAVSKALSERDERIERQRRIAERMLDKQAEILRALAER